MFLVIADDGSAMTDRIANISTVSADAINSELGLVVIGAQSPGDAITRVNTILGGKARARATTIVRTEIGRVFSAASFARMQQAVANGANIRKKWIRSGKVHSRPGHDAIHGEIKPVDEPFWVMDKNGVMHPLMFPHDPSAPASETINCGCVATPTASGFEGAGWVSMVGKADGTPYTNAELRARAAARHPGEPGMQAREAYDPQQKRAPAGSVGGGRWTKVAGGDGSVSRSSREITAFAERSFSATNKHELLQMGLIKNHQLILEKTGLDVSGYSRVLDNFGIKHTFNVHGLSATETLRGQRAVTAKDFSHIPEIVAHPDMIEHVGQSRVSKANLIRYTKRIGADTYHYIEEIRRKRRVLAIETLWISVKSAG